MRWIGSILDGIKLFLCLLGLIHLFNLESRFRNWLFGPPQIVKETPSGFLIRNVVEYTEPSSSGVGVGCYNSLDGKFYSALEGNLEASAISVMEEGWLEKYVRDKEKKGEPVDVTFFQYPDKPAPKGYEYVYGEEGNWYLEKSPPKENPAVQTPGTEADPEKP